MNAQRGVVPLQKGVYRSGKPRVVPELEGGANPPGQRREKRLQSGGVTVEERRQLIEHQSQTTP